MSEIPTIAEIEEAKRNMDTITEFVESSAATLVDQYGNTRETEQGLTDGFLANQTQLTEDFNTNQTQLTEDFNEAIRNAGGIAINNGVWASGVTFNGYNEYMVYNGVAYKPLTTTVLPYVSTAIPDTNKVQPFTGDISRVSIRHGESQITGLVVYPESQENTASTVVPFNTVVTGTNALRKADVDELYKTTVGGVLTVVSGEITALDFGALTATIGGVSVVLEKMVQLKNAITEDNIPTPPDASESVAGIAPIATQAIAEGGTNDTDIMTSLKVKQSIDKNVPDASETEKGKAQKASDPEVAAGNENTKFITAKQLKEFGGAGGVALITGTTYSAVGDEPETIVTNSQLNSVTTNSTYVFNNPFGNNTPVIVLCELLYAGRWADPSFIYSSGGYGTKASYVKGIGINLQSGDTSIVTVKDDCGTALAVTSTVNTGFQCRIWVTKRG